jgi:hypothetical protein
LIALTVFSAVYYYNMNEQAGKKNEAVLAVINTISEIKA